MLLYTVLSGVLVLAPGTNARADQGGAAFWLSGQYASLAATPSDPGASLSATPYYYSGSAAVSHAFERGDLLVSGLRSQSSLLMLQPGYTFDAKIAGGAIYMGLGFGYGQNDTQADLSIVNRGTVAATDTVWGWTDVTPFVSLTWSSGSNNWMTYLTGNAPVGSYDSSRLSNLGLGHAAIDGGAGYTYFNTQNGHEFSAVAGITYNFQNTEVSYRNGTDSHLDWAASQFLSQNFHMGVAGYVYRQFTADLYPTNGLIGELRYRALGAFESRIAGVGPEVGYFFSLHGQQAYINVRGYWEFAARYRIEGNSVFAALSIPF